MHERYLAAPVSERGRDTIDSLPLPRRILIVEDESIVALDVANRLIRLGYKVAGIAESADDALRLVGESSPHLVLMDIRLKGPSDGIAAAERIRDDYQLPVVYLTAYADDATLRRARVTEPFGYLLKPFDENSLRMVIEIALYKHQAESRLRASEQRYATTLNSIADAVIATDENERITLMNPVAESLTGWPLTQARGNPLQSVFRLDQQPETGNPPPGVQVEAVLHPREGAHVPIEYLSSPLRDDRHHRKGVVLVFRDITQRKNAELHRLHLEEQLHQAQKMEAIGKLAGGVAHDFNNMLTVIDGYGSLLIGEIQKQHPWYESLEAILDASARAGQVTRQLLAFARKQILQPKLVDVNQIVDQMVGMLGRVFSETIVVLRDLQTGIGQVKVDPGQFQLSLINLALNARDAMPQGGMLRIATREVDAATAQAGGMEEVESGRIIQLTIADTGTGMEPQTLARLFEPFFTTKPFGKGTGLGLASVYGFVKQSGGHIAVESALDCGTTFNLLLPVASAARPVAASEIDTQHRFRHTILVAEDEDSVRALACLTLRNKGYHVLEARDGREALEVAQSATGPVHLLVTDLVMPQLGGLELAEQLTRERRDLPVLFVTGYAEEASSDTLPPGTATEFLQKPFRPETLLTNVRKLLEPNPASSPKTV